jgi:tetratricopeptide (TPR) repeat protein
MKVAELKAQISRINVHRWAWYGLPVVLLLIGGCTAIRASSELQPGRYALMRGDSERALAHFQRAAAIDPNAAVQHGVMQEGVWTYVGRAYYDAGKYDLARKALEQARTRHPQDSLAPLYLGLTLSRDGDRQRGLKELQTGLTQLDDFFEYMEYYTSYGAYWDPGRIIRDRIDKDLAMTEGKDINWNELIASVELIGMQVEREATAVKDQLRKERRDSAKGDDKGT